MALRVRLAALSRLVASIALIAAPLRAQSSLPASDATVRASVVTDTVPPDTARHIPADDPYLYGVAVGAIVVPIVAAFAAAPLALWGGLRGPSKMNFLADHGAAQLTLGGIFTQGQTWADAADFEVVRNSVHAELQVEDYWRPRHVRYLTARGGYLWHPRSYTAGGVTIGYVAADGDPSQRGPELGLPLFAGSADALLRLEPTYVFSPSGILWSYRLQLEASLPGQRYFAGANMTWKSLELTEDDRPDFAARAVSIVVGTRF